MATALGHDDIFILIFSQCKMVSKYIVVSLLQIQWELFGFRNDLFLGQTCCVMDPLMGIMSRQKFKVQTSSDGLGILKTSSLCIILSMICHLLPPPPKKTELTSDVSLSLMFSAFDVNGNII